MRMHLKAIMIIIVDEEGYILPSVEILARLVPRARTKAMPGAFGTLSEVGQLNNKVLW